jgi:hypothetical protein
MSGPRPQAVNSPDRVPARPARRDQLAQPFLQVVLRVGQACPQDVLRDSRVDRRARRLCLRPHRRGRFVFILFL